MLPRHPFDRSMLTLGTLKCCKRVAIRWRNFFRMSVPYSSLTILRMRV